MPGTAVSSGSGNADSLDMGQASSEIQAYPGGEVPPTGERCMKLQAVGEGQQEESSVVFGAAGSSDQLEGVQEGTHFSNQGSGDTRGAGGQGSSRYQHTGTAEGQEQGGPEAAVNLPLLAQAEGGESGDSGLVRTGTAETPVAAGEQGSVGVAGVQGSGGSGGGGGMQGGRGKEGGQGGQGSAGVKGPGFLTVGELSHMGRGMHTTTCVTLIPLEGGARLADTPGFSQPSLEYVASQVRACITGFSAVGLLSAPCFVGCPPARTNNSPSIHFHLVPPTSTELESHSHDYGAPATTKLQPQSLPSPLPSRRSFPVCSQSLWQHSSQRGAAASTTACIKRSQVVPSQQCSPPSSATPCT